MSNDNAQYAPTSALAVARFFIEKAAEEGRRLTTMQVLKLVYIAHGWSLCFFKRKLFTQGVQAWRYGPVVPEVYQVFRNFGGGDINPAIANALPHLDDDTQRDALLNAVYRNYSNYSGPQLSTMTHRAGTPWDVTWNQLGGNKMRGATIDCELIRQHYEELRSKEPAPANG